MATEKTTESKEKPSQTVTGRDEKGRFLKGNSFNPGGQRSRDPLVAQLKKLEPQIIEHLAKVLARAKVKDETLIKIATLVFDRIYGKPVQAMEQKIEMEYNRTLVDMPPQPMSVAEWRKNVIEQAVESSKGMH